MPPLTSRRPSIVAWVVFIVAVLLGVGLVAIIIGTVKQSYMTGMAQYEQTTRPSSGAGGMGMVADEGMMGVSNYAPSPSDMKGAAPPMAPGSAAPTVPQRIIKTGSLQLRVDDTPNASERVKTIVTAKGGFVESSSMGDSGEGPRTAVLLVRVPVASFDAAMTEIKASAVVVLNESVSGQDVTMEFVDIEADLRNAKAEEASYLEIMKRSGKIEEVLQVARALAEVRGRIERLDGQKRYLENKTDLATISVTLTEETRVEAPTRTWKPLETLRQAGLELVQTLQAFVDFLIRFIVGLIAVLPFLAFTGLLIWIGWKLVKMFMRRMK